MATTPNAANTFDIDHVRKNGYYKSSFQLQFLHHILYGILTDLPNLIIVLVEPQPGHLIGISPMIKTEPSTEI